MSLEKSLASRRLGFLLCKTVVKCLFCQDKKKKEYIIKCIKCSNFWKSVSSFSLSSLQIPLRAEVLFYLYTYPWQSHIYRASRPGMALCPLTSKGDFSAQIAWFYHTSTTPKELTELRWWGDPCEHLTPTCSSSSPPLPSPCLALSHKHAPRLHKSSFHGDSILKFSRSRTGIIFYLLLLRGNLGKGSLLRIKHGVRGKEGRSSFPSSLDWMRQSC